MLPPTKLYVFKENYEIYIVHPYGVLNWSSVKEPSAQHIWFILDNIARELKDIKISFII